MNININNPRLKIFLAVLLIILLAVIVITAYVVNQRIKKESQAVPTETGRDKPIPLTQEQIDEALSQKVAPEEQDQVKPLTAGEINDALNQKLPESEVKPLSQEEIQQALNEKVK